MTRKSSVFDWGKYRTLYGFCESLFKHAGIKGYRFFLGEGHFMKLGEHIDPGKRNFVWPDVRTLPRYKSPIMYGETAQYDQIGTLLEVLLKVDTSLRIGNGQVCRFPVVRSYDEQPVNPGTFVNIEDDDVYLDGIRPTVASGDMNSDEPIQTVKLIEEKCKYVKEVREHLITTANNSISVNSIYILPCHNC